MLQKITLHCPKCQSVHIKKNGHKSCGQQASTAGLGALIGNSYKVVFGIEVGINTTAESIPYFTGKKESNFDNLGKSAGGVLFDSTYATVFSKSNLAVGFSADFIKNLSENKSAGDVALSSAVSSIAGKGASVVTKNESLQRVISSGSSKVYEYQKENFKDKNNEN